MIPNQIKMLTILLFVFCVFIKSGIGANANTLQKPNVIFILTDNHGYDLLGYTLNKSIKTPNIGQLANHGVLLTNAHVSSAICTPSCISIFLSQFEQKQGVNFNSGTSMLDQAWEQSYPMVPRKAKGVTCDKLVQSIDIAPTMLACANIDSPSSFQGKSLKAIVEGGREPVREFLFSENLWSTQLGNPRCDAVQNMEWKYIRYSKNDNLKASSKVEVAELLGIPVGDILYSQHDSDIATYRTFVEAPLKGEKPVFEELFNLISDPGEMENLATKEKYSVQRKEMRKAWKTKITYARGSEKPKVYTKDS